MTYSNKLGEYIQLQPPTRIQTEPTQGAREGQNVILPVYYIKQVFFAHFPTFVLCCFSKTDVLFSHTVHRKNQRINWHKLVLVTVAVKKWPHSFNLKPGWVLQQMCLHWDTAVEKWGDVFEKAGAYIKVATFIHPSPLHRINLCHICQIYPSLGITALAKNVLLPNLPLLYSLPAMTRTRAKATPVPSLIHEKYFHN